MRRREVEGVLRHCSEDFAWTIVGEKPLRGKDAIREMMARVRKTRPTSRCGRSSPRATSSSRRAT